jgi:predicted dehydrogenase
VVIDHMLEIRTAGVEGAAARTTFPMLNDKHPTVGTEGGLPGWLAKKRAACDQAVAQNNPMLQFTAEPNKGHLHQLERFCAEIRGKGPVVCGIDEAILATRVAHAAVKSAHEKRAVKLAEI